ncbi:MAG: hypothetical protein J0H15_13150 [Xanthomonadales bacterium]|nr:hypothetical protein [Xanthomonadales bacterium]
MPRNVLFSLVAAVAFAIPAAALAAPPAKAPAPQVAGEAVAYAELEHRVGATLVIETTHNTVRRGVLVKYTNVGLTIELGPDHGSIELSVPRDTIRSVRVLGAATADAR